MFQFVPEELDDHSLVLHADIRLSGFLLTGSLNPTPSVTCLVSEGVGLAAILAAGVHYCIRENSGKSNKWEKVV